MNDEISILIFQCRLPHAAKPVDWDAMRKDMDSLLKGKFASTTGSPPTPPAW